MGDGEDTGLTDDVLTGDVDNTGPSLEIGDLEIEDARL